ncbi:YfjI family protein [Paenibacillus sp. YYML68]|uniref:YfjI family protein n=1 Tax=Paenibacillus sp. YYML68 TaxID=2909250 RepID=UPI00249299D2|nr:YfjI family protein [Paenibacillus sp. YYML68]
MSNANKDDDHNSSDAVKILEQAAKALKWEEAPVEFEAHKQIAFPVQSLPEVLAQIVEQVSEVTQTATDAAGTAVLSMLSAAAARKFIVRLAEGEGWKEKNNLYVIIAMPSGERKSAVFSHLVKPLIKFEKKLDDPAFRTTHGIRVQQFVTDDVTPQALIQRLDENGEKMAVLSTEGGFFDNLTHKHYGNQAKLDVFLKAFTGDRMIIDRKHAPKIVLNDPTLTICLFVQPTVLQNLPEKFVGLGLLGRFLYAVPPSKRGYRDIAIKSIPDDLYESYSDLIHHLMMFEPETPVVLSLSEEAMNVFQEFRNHYEPHLREGEELSYDFLGTWSERFPGQIVRIASLLHVAEQAMYGVSFDESLDSQITKETMERALSLGEYFLEHAKAAFTSLKSSQDQEGAKYLLDVLKKKQIKVYKRQQLWSMVKGKFHTAERFDSALVILAERGYVRADITKSLRGRNGMNIECHPALIGSVNEVKPPSPKKDEG